MEIVYFCVTQFYHMNLRILPLSALAFLSMNASAEKIDIESFKYQGPFSLNLPVMVDSVDVNSKKFDPSSLLATPLSLASADKGRLCDGGLVLKSDSHALHLLNFTIDNERYVTASLKVDGLKNHEVYLDGKKLDSDQLLSLIHI